MISYILVNLKVLPKKYMKDFSRYARNQQLIKNYNTFDLISLLKKIQKTWKELFISKELTNFLQLVLFEAQSDKIPTSITKKKVILPITRYGCQ